MIDLNNLEEIKKHDPNNVFGSTQLFTKQCRQILEDLENITFLQSYKNISNIVFSGMGGSAFGAQVVFYLYKDLLPIPFYINNDYTLPYFANTNTLVIASSYSGNTEETIASINEAISRNCKVTGITTGGELSKILSGQKLPYLKFDPKNNPCGQPRLGTGYSVFGAIGLLIKLDVLNISKLSLLESIDFVEKSQKIIISKAQELAIEFYEKIPLIISGEFLVGASHVIRNQFNETSKSFSTYSSLPELNHHLMEGLKNPKNKNLKILFLESNLYTEKMKKRIELTKDVVSKNKIPFTSYKSSSSDKLGQVLEILSLGGFLTFYLSILYNQDPSLIPWVEYFKRNLK